MAAKNTDQAAETAIQNAEAEAHKIHPLLSQGNDVAPVTRGELKSILSGLLGAIGSGTPISVQGDEIGKIEQALAGLSARVKAGEDALAKLGDSTGKLVGLEFELKDRIAKLEEAVLRMSTDNRVQPAAPAAGSPGAPAIDLTGAEDLKKLTVQQLKDIAAVNNIDLSGVEGQKKEIVAEFIAAAMNVAK